MIPGYYLYYRADFLQNTKGFKFEYSHSYDIVYYRSKEIPSIIGIKSKYDYNKASEPSLEQQEHLHLVGPALKYLLSYINHE